MRLTVKMLKTMIKEEAEKLKTGLSESEKDEKVEDRAKDTKEVDADEFADTLEKKVDFIKQLGLKEAKLLQALKVVTERRRRIARSLSK